MARYIDAEALTDYMLERYNDLCEKHGDYDHYTTGYGDAIDVIEVAPTADVVPRAEVAREIFREIYAEIFEMFPLKVFRLIGGAYVEESFESGKERALHDVLSCSTVKRSSLRRMNSYSISISVWQRSSRRVDSRRSSLMICSVRL